MKKASSPKQQLEKLKRVNTRLKSELEECRETLRAIQQGEVDALVVNDGDSHHVFTLKNADQPYRVFVETMNEGAATLSPDGLIYYCNQRFADLMGCALETVIGGTIQEHFKNSTLPDFKEIVKQGQTTKGNRIFVNYPSQSRTIPLQLSMSVVQLEETQGICVVVTDLSEQRRLEESKADVERLNIERGIRERFVSTLAHDLRTPLTAGLLASQLLMRKDFSGEDVKKIAKRIARNMDRADGKIRDLLDTNRIRAGEGLPVSMEECLLPEVVENSISVLSEIYGPRFVVERSPKPIKGFWDSGAIQRCIENLAANAIKYGKPRAIVTIGTEATKNKVVISVHNEGNPISKEDQASLFGDYRRTESAVQSGQKGWGIGLTLVKGFMEAHFGKVRVKSDAQSGTTFSIELPIDARKEQRV